MNLSDKIRTELIYNISICSGHSGLAGGQYSDLTFENKKVSKKNAEYTGKAIVEKETMYNAGEWYLVMKHCEGTFTKKYKQDLGLLSWQDYKNFNSGYAKYAENFVVTKCDQETVDNLSLIHI